ncbi:mechanosensitive ion channel family protein [Kocuria sp. M4R2S49]|uniref:mechanosensitive ion channel family protein n=1 Tax=Kocuria rhizosphaericola TaxID=3376284 RepID=UPI0037A99887
MMSEALVAEQIRLPPIRFEDLLLGAGIVLGGYLLSRLLRFVLRRVFRARGRGPSYAAVFSTIGGWVFLTFALAVGLTIAFPSVRFSSILGGLGIVSVAVGIAAQSVLGNLFAGVLTVYREPFRAGDQVAIGDVSGTVIDVNLREIVIRTFDGKRVLIPNSVAHGGVITVQTGYERTRSTVLVGVAYGTDLERARELALAAVRGVPAVHDDPPPRALVQEAGASTVNIAVMFWSGSQQMETNEALDAVISALVRAYRSAGIEIPAEIRQLELGPSAAWIAERLAGGADGDRRGDEQD